MKALRPGRAALHGDVVHEDRALAPDTVNIGRFADHQAAVIDARLHPADVITHDEEDVGFLCLLPRRGWRRLPDLRLAWTSLLPISAAVAASSDKPIGISLRFIV